MRLVLKMYLSRPKSKLPPISCHENNAKSPFKKSFLPQRAALRFSNPVCLVRLPRHANHFGKGIRWHVSKAHDALRECLL